MISAVTLVMGLIVYLFFNQATYLSLFFLSIMDLPKIKLDNSVFNELVNSFLADFLWSVAFTFAIQGLLELKGRNIFYLGLTSLLGVAVELLQLLNYINGVFDYYDIVVYVAGSIFSIMIIIMGRKKHEN